MFHELSSTLEHIKAGKLKVLGAGSETRLPELPDVPTISEVLPGFVATTWLAVVATPKTPPEVAARLSEAIAESHPPARGRRNTPQFQLYACRHVAAGDRALPQPGARPLAGGHYGGRPLPD